MSQNTAIEWTSATWNPVEGCSMAKGSENGGCLNCYAARQALRRPAAGLAVMRDSGPRWTGKVQLVEKRLEAPLHWKKPQRIFVNSMSDLFHEALQDEAIDRVFAVMALCPHHTFQVLTKRAERMFKYLSNPDLQDRLTDLYNKEGWQVMLPLANVWVGVSVENQATADARIPLLLQAPAAKRFVSYEPALGPVDFGRCYREHDGDGLCDHEENGIDWIIVGGESGPGARPFDILWARNTVRQCGEALVACFVKQLGSNPYVNHAGYPDYLCYLKDRKGGDMSEWPEDLRVREFPV